MGRHGWYCYGYLNKTQKDEDGYDLFQPKWKVDCNELSYRKDKEGKKIPYATPPGPSELIGTPVLYEDKVYCATGQDPEHGDGVGRLMYRCKQWKDIVEIYQCWPHHIHGISS